VSVQFNFKGIKRFNTSTVITCQTHDVSLFRAAGLSWCTFRCTDKNTHHHNVTRYNIFRDTTFTNITSSLLGDRQQDHKLQVGGKHFARDPQISPQRITNGHNSFIRKLTNERLAIQGPRREAPEVGVSEPECRMIITCATIINWNWVYKSAFK
jgi:hypothetical protein